MACEDKQAAFTAAMNTAQQQLKESLSRIAQVAEAKAKNISDEFEQGNDLAQGVGAAAGAVVGGVFGGPGGAAAGTEMGRLIGSLFVLKVDTQRVEFALDVPTTTMKTQEWSFDSPVVIMQDKEMTFDLPVVVMVRRAGPDIPETVCRMETRDLGFGVKIDVPVCYVEMKPTSIDIPEVQMQTQRIVVGLPEVRMVTQSFKLDVPEFAMARQSLSFDIPRISLEFVKDAGSRTAAAAAAIAQEAQTAAMQKQVGLREELRLAVIGPCNEMFSCYREQLELGRSQVLAMFDPQISQITDSVKSLISKGVAEASTEVATLRETLDRVVAERDKALSGIDRAISELAEASRKALDQFINQDPEENAAATAAAA